MLCIQDDLCYNKGEEIAPADIERSAFLYSFKAGSIRCDGRTATPKPAPTSC